MPLITHPHIHITHDAHKRLLAICQAALPNEACGILISGEDAKSAAGEPIVDSIRAIANNHSAPQRSFSFEPFEWTAAFFETQKNRQRIVGFFHSHPASDALPSLDDELGFLPADGSYWIISLKNRDIPYIQPFAREDGAFLPLTLVLA